MINGIGPGGQVRANMAFSNFHNNYPIMVKDPNPEKTEGQNGDRVILSTKKVEVNKKGALLIPTYQKLNLFLNLSEMTSLDDIEYKDQSLTDFNPMCVDIAPFLSRPFTEKVKQKKGADPSKQEMREYPP